MKYKVGDLVYFDDGVQKGVGKVIVVDDGDYGVTYLVHSTQIIGGHDGNGCAEKQDNENNLFFMEKRLKPFFKKVGQKYKVIRNLDEDAEISIGDIITLISTENDNLSYYESEDVPSLLMYDLDNKRCEVEFYEDVEDAPSAKENGMFKKDDLKVGYLVKVRNGEFAHVVNTINNGMCFNYERSWSTVANYNENLTNVLYDDFDIVEVYGLTEKGCEAHKFGINDRNLLWKREEVKEMTIEEIQKALGHKIKVVE